jgi:hypothetical protein
MGSEPVFVSGRPCDLPGCASSAECATRRRMIEWIEISDCGPSRRAVEAGGSPALERRAWVGAAPTTTGRAGTARRLGSGKRDGKAQRERTSGRTPLSEASAPTWRMWAETQCTPTRLGPATPWPVFRGWRGGHEECLRRTCGEAAGEKLGAVPVDRSSMNVGTILGLPAVCGQARCRLSALGWGGAFVVVRGRESRPHGEGRQRTCSVCLEGEEVGVE